MFGNPRLTLPRLSPDVEVTVERDDRRREFAVTLSRHVPGHDRAYIRVAIADFTLATGGPEHGARIIESSARSLSRAVGDRLVFGR